jgi:hypothetical protein
MGERDHSIECEVCGYRRGGLNDYKCQCDLPSEISPPVYSGFATATQADAARALIDALIYPGRDFESAWDNACLHWGRFGEAPAKVALLEAALLEACDIALSGSADRERIGALRAVATE